MEYRDTNQDTSNELRSLTIITFLIIITLAILSVSCEDKCETFYSYTTYDPIYTTTQELRNAVEILDAKTINAPGKIYMLDKYLLINEVGMGIHIINNENNRAPKPVSFINIPGNYDLAGKGNYIYADSYVDLLVFDLSNIANIKLVARVEGVFQNYYNTFGYTDGRGIITEYKERLVEEMIETDCGSGQMFLEDGFNIRPGNFDMRASTSSAGSPTAAGIGGSMARFTISGDQLYTVDYSTLRTFDISDIAKPKVGAVTQIGWGIETIFPYKSNLFLGAQNGMYIFDRANDGSVSLLSKYEHITSCDPVVVQDEIAYVTLRNGVECNGFTNQLEIIDVSNLKKPEVMGIFQMENPHGLGIDETCLFITEGEFGMKVYNAQIDKKQIKMDLLKNYKDIHAFDVIPFNNVLMMIGNDGLYQFEYNCGTGEMSLLSTLTIQPL